MWKKERERHFTVRVDTISAQMIFLRWLDPDTTGAENNAICIQVSPFAYFTVICTRRMDAMLLETQAMCPQEPSPLYTNSQRRSHRM